MPKKKVTIPLQARSDSKEKKGLPDVSLTSINTSQDGTCGRILE